MGVTIEAVQNRRDLDHFQRLPWAIYRGDPNWVPPILVEQRKLFDRAHHPFHEHGEVELLLARESNRVVGRIAAIHNRLHNEYHGDRVGFFGFYESIDSVEVAAALLDAAGAWLRARGLDTVRGPMNFSTNDECAFLLEGFDSPPVFMMTYNPPYYLRLMEACGLQKAKDLYAYFCPLDPSRIARLDRLERICQRVRSRANVTIRTGELKRFAQEVDELKVIYNRAWTNNWGFVPMTDAEISAMARDLKDFVVPELVLFAEVDGEPAGVCLTLPDYNQAIKHMNGRMWPFGVPRFLWHRRRIDRVRLMALGTVREHQRKGLDAVLMLESLKTAIRLGYKHGELSWTLEDNDLINNTIATFDLARYKTYRIYERKLAGSGSGS